MEHKILLFTIADSVKLKCSTNQEQWHKWIPWVSGLCLLVNATLLS